MTREEAIGNLIHAIRWNDMPKKESLDMAIKALEQEPCDDCISRQAVLEAIKNYASMVWERYHEPFPESTIMEIIQALPSVTPPQPKTGYISIDDVMSVFDDFMCGEVDEDGTDTFLEMLKDKAEGSEE